MHLGTTLTRHGVEKELDTDIEPDKQVQRGDDSPSTFSDIAISKTSSATLIAVDQTSNSEDKFRKQRSTKSKTQLEVPWYKGGRIKNRKFFKKKTNNKAPEHDCDPTLPVTPQKSHTNLKLDPPLLKLELSSESLELEKYTGTQSKRGQETNDALRLEIIDVKGIERELAQKDQDNTALKIPNFLVKPGIDPQLVADEVERAKKRAQFLQAGNNFYRRCQWADNDREQLLNIVVELRRCNNDLDALVRLKVPDDPTQILRVPNPDRQQIRHIEIFQHALKRVHETVMSVNSPAGSKGYQSVLDVQVVEDPEQPKADLTECASRLRLRSETWVFVLQAHTEGWTKAQKRSILTYAEVNKSLESTESNLPEWIEMINSLPSALSDLEILPGHLPYGVLGAVSRIGSPADRHHLFYSAEYAWNTETTLQDVLDHENFETRLTLQQRLQLARLVALSFLYFGKISSSTTIYPRPERLRFYQVEGQNMPWVENEPFVLNPYVSIGFGSAKTNRVVGSSSGAARQMSNPVVELGLVLFQVGSCSKLNYGSGLEGVRKAKKEALRQIRKLDVRCGGHFAEVVQLCLDWGTSIFAPVSSGDYQLIQRVITWLRSQEERSWE